MTKTKIISVHATVNQASGLETLCQIGRLNPVKTIYQWGNNYSTQKSIDLKNLADRGFIELSDHKGDHTNTVIVHLTENGIKLYNNLIQKYRGF